MTLTAKIDKKVCLLYNKTTSKEGRRTLLHKAVSHSLVKGGDADGMEAAALLNLRHHYHSGIDVCNPKSVLTARLAPKRSTSLIDCK